MRRKRKQPLPSTYVRIEGPELEGGGVDVPYDNPDLGAVLAQGFASKAKSKAPVYLIYVQHVVGPPELAARVWRDEVDEVIYTHRIGDALVETPRVAVA